MKEEKNQIQTWVKSHKKQLVFVAIGITATLGIIYGIRNRTATAKLLASHKAIAKQVGRSIADAVPAVQLTETVVLEPAALARSYTKPTVPFDVTGHVRNLPEGQHHSVEKAAQAAARNIFLKPNQTLVDTYTKYAA